MNERIKELAERATKQVTKPDGHYIVQEWQKVFAELIIKECVGMLDDEDDYGPYSTGVRSAAYRIKKRFGVE